jgi:DNA-binding NarL/FixJ family response regulator
MTAGGRTAGTVTAEGVTAEGVTIRVVIADDHRVVRDGLCYLLSQEPGVEVAGEAGDGRQAVDVVAATRPDVLLLDLYMPGLDGHAVLAALRDAPHRPAVVVLTSAADDEHLVRAMQAGATSYLLKTASAEQVIAAVRDAAAGTASLSPELLTRLTQALRRPPPPDPLRPLSPRERDVLRLIARGHSNRQIARDLAIGEQTVKTHVRSILAKLGLQDRVQAAIFALRHQKSLHGPLRSSSGRPRPRCRCDLVRKVDPASRRHPLHGHVHALIVARGTGVPRDLIEKPRRDDHRQHARCLRQRPLQRAGLQQPARQVDRCPGHSVLVITDLSGVQRHPQPDLLRTRMRGVVPAKPRYHRRRQGFHEQALGHLGRDQDQDTITAILVIAVIPRDPRAGERLAHDAIEAVTNCHLVNVSAALVSEPLDVDHDDSPVNRQQPISHLAPARHGDGRSNAFIFLPQRNHPENSQIPGAVPDLPCNCPTAVDPPAPTK